MMTQRFRRAGLLTLFVLLLSLLGMLSVSAEDTVSTEALPEEYFALLDSLPDEVLEQLPDGIFSSDSAEMGTAVSEMSDFSYLLQTVLTLVGMNLGDCAKLLATVAGLLLLSAVCKTVEGSFRSGGISRAFSLCSSLIILIALLTSGYQSIGTVTDYFTTLRAVTASSVPLMGALYAMGGNVSAAVASSSGLSLFMTFVEEVIGTTIVPFCGICLAFALVGALDPSLRIHTLSATLKKNYTTALAFLMMLLLAMLSAQTLLGAKSDTLAMKSAKFAAGNMIPVVGGSISELLRTVSASVGYLRGGVGICGILLLLLLLLPTLVELFLMRFTWQICASLADLLGCDTEKKLLEEFASINGFLIAAAAICSAVPLLAFALLSHCASAIG